MRPRGSIRKAVAAHLEAAASGATWRDLASRLGEIGLIDVRAPSELRLVRKAVENMKQAGEIEPVGVQPSSFKRRPLKLYGARRARVPTVRDASAELAGILGGWQGVAE